MRSAATAAVVAHAPAGTNAAGESAPPVPKMSFLVFVEEPGTTIGTVIAGAEAASPVSVICGVSSMGLGGSRGAATPPTGLAAGILAGSPVLARSSDASGATSDAMSDDTSASDVTSE